MKERTKTSSAMGIGCQRHRHRQRPIIYQVVALCSQSSCCLWQAVCRKGLCI